jgi:hypothetical protein
MVFIDIKLAHGLSNLNIYVVDELTGHKLKRTNWCAYFLVNPNFGQSGVCMRAGLHCGVEPVFINRQFCKKKNNTYLYEISHTSLDRLTPVAFLPEKPSYFTEIQYEEEKIPLLGIAL